jgi:hypothetical protein
MISRFKIIFAVLFVSFLYLEFLKYKQNNFKISLPFEKYSLVEKNSIALNRQYLINEVRDFRLIRNV